MDLRFSTIIILWGVMIDFSPENYSFAEGWKDGKFDPTKLTLVEQKKWGEALGITFDLVSKKRVKNYLRGNPWEVKQVNFYQERLEEGRDFRVKKREDKRFDLDIYNPSLTCFYEEDLPPIGPRTQDSIIGGLVTNCALRTITHDVGKHRKVVWITKNEKISKEVQNILNLKRVEYSPLDYFEEGEKCYSVWFYGTSDVRRYLLPDFEYLDEEIKKLPNFGEKENVWMVLYEQANLRRHKNYKKMKEDDRIPITAYKEELNEFYLIKRKLKEAMNIYSNLKDSMPTLEFFQNKEENLNKMKITAGKIKTLQNMQEDIREKLYGKKTQRKKSSSNWRQKQIWNDIRTLGTY